MDFRIEDAELVEINHYYYRYTKEDIKKIISKDIQAITADEWKTLIQMIYPTDMIASGLFQPILIFKIDASGKRMDPPYKEYDTVNQIKDGACLLLKIMDHVEKNGLQFDKTWIKMRGVIRLGMPAKSN